MKFLKIMALIQANILMGLTILGSIAAFALGVSLLNSLADAFDGDQQQQEQPAPEPDDDDAWLRYLDCLDETDPASWETCDVILE